MASMPGWPSTAHSRTGKAAEILRTSNRARRAVASSFHRSITWTGRFITRPRPSVFWQNKGASMNISDIQTLYDYHYWATQRILSAAARVSAEQFVAPCAYKLGSLRGTLAHLLDAEYGWRMLLQHSKLD